MAGFSPITDMVYRDPKAETGRNAPSIALITRKWAPAMGGMETWSMKVAEALAERTHVDIIALPGRPDGMPPHALALLLFPFVTLWKLLRLKPKPQVALLGDMAIWPIGFLLKATGFRASIFIAAHGTDAAYHRRGGIKGSAYGAYLRLGARLLKRSTVIANSRATADVLAETGWSAAEIIPLATSDDGAETLPDLKNDERFLLFAGRLVARKGCGWFVRHVLDRLPSDVHLKIAGTGWDPSEQFVLQHPRVQFLGQQDQPALRRIYADACCVILPNIELENGEYEGFGLVAVEAAAAGGIVLAANHGGLRDAVIDGKTGFLVPSGVADAWVEAIAGITAMSQDERMSFIANSRDTVSRHYSWDRVASDILALSVPAQQTPHKL